MATPDKLIPVILSHEGGATNNPADPAAANPSPFVYKGQKGWHTVKGITWATFSQWADKLKYAASAENFFTMPMAIWQRIFTYAYWNALKLGELKSNGVAYFDWRL